MLIREGSMIYVDLLHNTGNYSQHLIIYIYINFIYMSHFATLKTDTTL